MSDVPDLCIVIHETTPEGLAGVFDGMNKAMRDFTDKAARGECAWICSDCCCSDQKGMPDACFHGDQRCTDIIKRDKGRVLGYPDEQ